MSNQKKDYGPDKNLQRQMDRRTDRRTDSVIPIYPLNFIHGGIIKGRIVCVLIYIICLFFPSRFQYKKNLSDQLQKQAYIVPVFTEQIMQGQKGVVANISTTDLRGKTIIFMDKFQEILT